MKRLKALVICCVAAVCAATLLTGCSFSLPETSYTPPEKTPVVTAPAILNDGVLTVGVDAQSAPFAGQPANSSKIVGINVDVAAALADQLGLKLNIVDVGSDPAAALAEGKVDIVMCANSTNAKSGFWTSESYLSTGVALFAPASVTTPPAATTTDSIGAQLSSKSAWAVANAYKSAKIVTSDTLENSFASLAAGEVQYVASDLVTGTYVLHSTGSDAHAVALLQSASGYCVGVANTNSELKQYISEALSALIDGGIIKVIETKWLGAPIDLSALKVVDVSASTADSKKNADDTDKKEADEEEGGDAPASATNKPSQSTSSSATAQPV